jgi:hypothetical protein
MLKECEPLMRRWGKTLVLALLWLTLLCGVALAHSMPMRATWTITPGQPVLGEPARVTVAVGDQLGGLAAGLAVHLTATAAGQPEQALTLVEGNPGEYSGELKLPAAGEWTLAVEIQVLDEIQTGSQTVTAVTRAPADNPPLTVAQWLTVKQTPMQQLTTWGALVVGLLIIAALLLTGRKPAKDTTLPDRNPDDAKEEAHR